ncbi:MAG: hypothetical protein QOI47_1832 [Actinomycetota bacterium]|nr:hypothetical protein [Actinomycetota bacterium]
MLAPVAAIDGARAALRAGDGAAARNLLQDADPARGDVSECLARAAYLLLDFDAAIELWERAYAAHRDARDQLGAVRVARTLAYMNGMVRGDGAVMSGWLSRAQTLLDGAEESSEWGWVALNRGMFEGDRRTKEQRFGEALTTARRLGDVDLEIVTLAYLGASLVHDGRTEEGMMLLDEALAAVAGHEADDFLVLEEVFCQLFSACEHAHDVTRADEWIRVGDAIAARRRLPSVAAFCHTHYGGLLTAAGRWPEADATLSDAIRLWGGDRRGLRNGALLRLADLRVRQGRFEEAAQLLDGFSSDWEAARAMASIQLARGDTALARDTLERGLNQVGATSGAAVPMLALLVDVHLATGALDSAASAVAQLDACVTPDAGAYVRAVAALARGSVCLASGTGDPIACMREAVSGFERARLPMELAHTRLALADAVASDRPEVAIAEARRALEGFETLQAARGVDAASALLRSLGATGATRRRGDGALTKREAEVLALLGHGMSNPEISDRLFISRKTVEHHVGNVLAKLGLRSRGEAAAHAVRQEQGRE